MLRAFPSLPSRRAVEKPSLRRSEEQVSDEGLPLEDGPAKSTQHLKVPCRGSALVWMQLQKAAPNGDQRCYSVLVDVEGASKATTAKMAWLSMPQSQSSSPRVCAWHNVVMDKLPQSRHREAASSTPRRMTPHSPRCSQRTRADSSGTSWRSGWKSPRTVASRQNTGVAGSSASSSSHDGRLPAQRSTHPPDSQRPASRSAARRSLRRSSGMSDYDDDLLSTSALESSSGLGVWQGLAASQSLPPMSRHMSPAPPGLSRPLSTVSKGSRAPEALLPKLQAKEIAQMMARSMEKSFGPEVWEACGLSHPDAENLKGWAPSYAELAADRLHDNEAWKEVQTWDTLPRRTQVQSTMESDPEDVLAAVHKDLETAQLARDTGWGVLDVEEVRDRFDHCAPEGVLQPMSAEHIALLSAICPGVSVSEVSAHNHELKQPGAEMEFADFFTALVRWLAVNSVKKAPGVASCTLRRCRDSIAL
mmetsp:Transcript_46823/g.111396  ORF Transcript_46823/g.111396 Transcript_46823/m.111396 type:complete len:475 (-) Transcript_46823:32-1456(-)